MPLYVHGVDEFKTALAKISADITGTAMPEARKEAAEMLVQQAQSRAPVRTGYLRDSIKLSGEDSESVTVVVEAEYAIYVEEGTYKMAARPFFFPAAQEVENTYPAIMGKKINVAVKEHWG